MILTRLIYYSLNLKQNTPDDISRILESARRNNRSRDITGVLLFNHNYFVQSLEGRRDRITQTFTRIAEDSRHKGVVLAGMQDTPERNFPDWSMKYISDISQNRMLQLQYSTDDRFDPTIMTYAQLSGLLGALSDLNSAK